MSNSECRLERYFPSLLRKECPCMYVCAESWEVGQRRKCLTCVIECLWKTADRQMAGCTKHRRNGRKVSRHRPSFYKEKSPTQWKPKICLMNKVLYLFTVKRKERKMTTDTTGIRRVIRKYYEQLYAKNWIIWKKWIETCNLPRLTQVK